MNGIIIKSIGGLYFAESSDGVYECRARGIFRKQGVSPAVGDNVVFENGVITEISERKNCLIRPLLANLDYLVFVISVSQPAPNMLLLDKFIAVAEYQGIAPIIAVTKIDIESCEKIVEIYKSAGITVFALITAGMIRQRKYEHFLKTKSAPLRVTAVRESQPCLTLYAVTLTFLQGR